MTIAREEARLSNGRFGTQSHTPPEATLTGPSPKQLGMMGAGPDSVNVFAEPWDEDEMRPLRPYLPLTPADDDEFFDARPGTRLNVVEKNEAGGTSIRTFVRSDDGDTWEERSQLHDVFQRDVPAGELWADLFEEDGTMRSSLLQAPVGVLYSDQRYYISRDDVDKQLTTDDAIYRLSGARRGRLVSRSVFGDHRDDGVPEAFRGELALELRDNGYFSFAGIGRGRQAKRGFPLERVQIFDREGDLVFRMEHDAGYGWEEVLRLTDGADPLPWAHDHDNLCDETRMSGKHPARSATKETEDDYWDPRY